MLQFQTTQSDWLPSWAAQTGAFLIRHGKHQCRLWLALLPAAPLRCCGCMQRGMQMRTATGLQMKLPVQAFTSSSPNFPTGRLLLATLHCRASCGAA